MRVLKGLVFVAVGLFIVVTCISLLMPSTVVVTRAEIMPGDSASAAMQVRDLENWKHWHPYFAGQTVEQGKLDNGNAYLQWEHKGNTYRFEELMKYPNGLRVAFVRSGENDVINDVTVFRAGLQNQVEWKAVNKIKWYPWEKFGALFLNDITGPGYEEALKSLGNYLEKN